MLALEISQRFLFLQKLLQRTMGIHWWNTLNIKYSLQWNSEIEFE